MQLFKPILMYYIMIVLNIIWIWHWFEFVNFSVQVSATCDNTFDQQLNLIYTTNYPSYYKTNESCSWKVFTPIQGEQIQLHFVDFQTMPGSDKLYVYDGENSSSPLIATYDGFEPDGSVPDDTITTGNYLTLIFNTLHHLNPVNSYRGFEIMYFLKSNFKLILTTIKFYLEARKRPQHQCLALI